MKLHSISSLVSEVTVYSDRAQITRAGQITLSAGEYTVVFADLPDAIEADSLRVSGAGSARLNDVKLTRTHYTVIPDDHRRVLENERDKLNEPIEEIADQQKRIKKEREFVEGIAATLAQMSNKPNSYPLEPKRWISMVDFYRSRLAALDQEAREASRKRQQLELEIDRLTREINDSGTTHTKSGYQVAVSLELQQDAEITLELKYIVYGPSWYPTYDLRVDSEQKRVAITYQAMVQQATSEDWDDVLLKLSTAQPQIGGEQPHLSPWRIAERASEVVKRSRDTLRNEPERMKSAVAPPASAESQMFAAGAVEEVLKKKRIQIPTAQVESLATSVVFSIPGRKSIKSDNQSYRVSVAMDEYPAHFRYSTVPKLTPYAYLKAKVVHTGEYPLLPGDTQVFLDNQFVAKSRMPLVVSGEEFWTYLGIDASMKVEYQFLRRQQTQAGLLNKVDKFTYSYKITLTNNKKTTEEIVVWDQLPISSQQKLLVELIDPVYREDSESFKKNDLNYLEWFFKLSPGEKKIVPLVFSVEHPQGMLITGL